MGVKMKNKINPIVLYIVFSLLVGLVAMICVMFGSVNVSFSDTFHVVSGAMVGKIPESVPERIVSIILMVRLPRVLTAAFIGAALSISGAAMQGLLKNPLADGSTLGVSSGASLGAVLAIALSTGNSFFANTGIFVMSILFAFISMLLILGLSRAIDYSLSTNTIILVGVIFSMFTGSITSLVVTVASNKVKNIVFWSMGSLAGSSYKEVLLMSIILFVIGAVLIGNASELNAFAIGEENAMHIGVNIRKVKLVIMIAVSILIGISVAISGTIGFVGLIIPHIARLITGPNHKRMLPMSLFIGASFLMIADLISRTILSPMELPIGVITSFAGSILFIYLYFRLSKGNRR